MIEMYVKEFTSIVNTLIRNEKGLNKRDFLYIEREELDVLLNKNAYETPENKLKNWRNLWWIHADEGHLTCKIMVKNKRIRMVKISLSVHECLLQLLPRPQSHLQNEKSEQIKTTAPPTAPPAQKVLNQMPRPQSQSQSEKPKFAVPTFQSQRE